MYQTLSAPTCTHFAVELRAAVTFVLSVETGRSLGPIGADAPASRLTHHETLTGQDRKSPSFST
jgi:hypothetical protein